MRPPNPFEAVREQAQRANACPIEFLDDFYTNHWDVSSLCGAFECRECVADPMDIGLGPWDDEPPCDEGDCDLTIPF